MKVTEGAVGRVFIIRLEDGDILPDCIEQFALQNNINIGHVAMIGCLNEGNIVVGPRKTHENPPDPMVLPIDGAHETIATGLLAPTESGKPILHIHGALGRAGKTTTGCLRNGVKTWLVGEVIIYEIIGAEAKRLYDETSGFTLLSL